MSYHISLLFISVLFLGCTSSKNVEPPIDSNRVHEVKEPNKQTIEGNYTLERGVYSYSGELTKKTQEVTDSKLFVEQLDDNDYGYFLVMNIANIKTPIEESGIFHKKDDGKYVKRLIFRKDITKDSNITDISNAPKPEILDDEKNLETVISDEEVKINPLDGEGLNIVMKMVSGGEINVTWNRDYSDDASFYSDENMKEAKKDYIKSYRDRFIKFYKDLD